MRYPVFLEQCSDGSWSVGVPDLLGCASAGRSVEDALANAREAILFHLEGMAEDGQAAPAPGSIDRHRAHPDWATADLWALVEVPEQDLPGKAVRLNISMNERVLSVLDAAAKAEGETRSGLLARAVLAHLGPFTRPRTRSRKAAAKSMPMTARASGRASSRGRTPARRG